MTNMHNFVVILIEVFVLFGEKLDLLILIPYRSGNFAIQKIKK